MVVSKPVSNVVFHFQLVQISFVYKVPYPRPHELHETPLEQKLEEESQQVGQGVPPAGLLVFLHGTWFLAVDCLISMFLMEPTGSRRRQGSGGRSCSLR